MTFSAFSRFKARNVTHSISLRLSSSSRTRGRIEFVSQCGLAQTLSPARPTGRSHSSALFYAGSSRNSSGSVLFPIFVERWDRTETGHSFGTFPRPADLRFSALASAALRVPGSTENISPVIARRRRSRSKDPQWRMSPAECAR